MAGAIFAIVGFLFAAAIGLAIGFFIFSLILNQSNNFGDSFRNDNPLTTGIVLTSKADQIQHRVEVFQYHLDYGMRDLVNQPTYQAMMEHSIKKSDNEQVAHQK